MGVEENVIVNVGCGTVNSGAIPDYFTNWRMLRVDVDASVEPDIVADAVDLSVIRSGTVDAIWAAHCIEHLYQHDVSRALAEFYRILKDTGFICIIVPDLQAVGNYLSADRLHQVVYQSPAGPITAHDILFGLGHAVAAGHQFMAHRCGFTPTLTLQLFEKTQFKEVFIRRRAALELAVVARKQPYANATERDALINALRL